MKKRRHIRPLDTERSDAWFTGKIMSKYEARWLDMQIHSVPRMDTISCCIELYRQHRTMEKMYSEYYKAQQANRELWRQHKSWITNMPSGFWPNGKPIEPPKCLLLILKKTTIWREMKRAGVSIAKGLRSKFRRYDIGEWVMVAEKSTCRDKYYSRYNVSHVHVDGTHWLSGHIDATWPHLEIKLGQCLKCKAEMPRHIEAWIRMIRLQEKLGE